MRRVTVALILIVVGSLMVVAPASAATLHGQWTGGVASGTGGSLPDWGLAWNASEILGASGNVTIAMYPTYTDVASLMVITAGPTVPPFPVKVNAQSFFGWGPAVWNAAAGTYTVSGTIRSVTYKRAGLTFTATLVAKPATGDLTLTIFTGGSGWGWDHWTLYGVMR
jgi:hypothetical protein